MPLGVSVEGIGLENPVHLLIVAVVALLVLGPKRLPEAGRAAGRSFREFKDAISGGPKGTPASDADELPEPTDSDSRE